MKEVIISIRKIGIELSKWVAYATAMIDSIDVDSAKAPQNNESCDFGLWYKEDQWNLSKFSEYSSLGKHHKELHNLYKEMMKVVEHSRKKTPSFFDKVMRSEGRLTNSDRKKLSKKYQEFKEESTAILSLLKELQSKVKSGDMSTFSNKAA